MRNVGEKRGSGGHRRDGAARGGDVVGDGTAGVTHPCGLAALAAFGPVAHFGSSAPFERGRATSRCDEGTA